MQSNWEKVVPIPEPAAGLFYGRLFELDPGLKPMFKSDIKKQGKKLMQMTTVAVSGLNDLNKLVPTVQALGRRRVGYGVKEEHCRTVGTALVWTLENGLGNTFTPASGGRVGQGLWRARDDHAEGGDGDAIGAGLESCSQARTNSVESKPSNGNPMKPRPTQLKKSLTGGALVMAIAASVFAQEKPFTQPGTGQPPAPPPPPKAATAATASPSPAPPAPEPGAVDKFFNGKIPDAIAKGKFNLNVRLRYEFVDQDGVAAITEDSHAPTIRTRFGYTSAPLYGFQGMLEGENVTVIGPEHNFNAAGSNGQPDKPVVADPPTTELNQAWLAYAYTNWISTKVGRQRIALDNHRFVGDVGWRQNMQTFDAVTAVSNPFKDLGVYYGYVWDVRRVFGDVPDLPAASPNRDFASHSHLVNISYAPCAFAQFAGYAYLLDLDLNNGTAAANDNSCATYGGYFAGSAPVTGKLALAYRAEFAWQTDYADSALDYSTEYYNLELSGNVKPFAFGAGYEVLGSASNDNAPGTRASFRTPLATLHAFNGWADVFLNTPADGLCDLYGFAQVTLPYNIPLRLVYHKFDADSGSGDYGQEFDVVASRKFGKHWTAMLKYSFYDGDDAAPPALAVADVEVHKFWAQVEFNF